MSPRHLFTGLAAATAVSLLALGMPAQAQPTPLGGPGSGLNFDFATLSKAKAGTWADYAMAKVGGTDKPITIRYSLVERTAQKIGLEVDTLAPKGELLLRFDFGPVAPDAWKISGGKMQVAEQKMDMPAAQLAQAPAIKTTEPPGELVGAESVTTPAGTFACKHYRKAATDPKSPTMDLWISDKVQPTGMVRFTLSGTGVDMTLTGTGAGAQAKLK
jgi:hypothetical protein